MTNEIIKSSENIINGGKVMKTLVFECMDDKSLGYRIRLYLLADGMYKITFTDVIEKKILYKNTCDLSYMGAKVRKIRQLFHGSWITRCDGNHLIDIKIACDKCIDFINQYKGNPSYKVQCASIDAKLFVSESNKKSYNEKFHPYSWR